MSSRSHRCNLTVMFGSAGFRYDLRMLPGTCIMCEVFICHHDFSGVRTSSVCYIARSYCLLRLISHSDTFVLTMVCGICVHCAILTIFMQRSFFFIPCQGFLSAEHVHGVYSQFISTLGVNHTRYGWLAVLGVRSHLQTIPLHEGSLRKDLLPPAKYVPKQEQRRKGTYTSKAEGTHATFPHLFLRERPART
ncbi:unnamed protein product, partial [Ectocarpus sp. 4 AP-2014]